MARKDFITSIVLIAFSVGIIVQSCIMPRLERRGIDPFSAPGVVPGIVGAVLLCLALILFFRSIRSEGYRAVSGTSGSVDSAPQKGGVTRVALTLCLSLIYAVGFLGHFDYFIITALYIFTFICVFEFQPKISIANQKKMVLFASIQAVAASLLITLVFQKLFLVDLP